MSNRERWMLIETLKGTSKRATESARTMPFPSKYEKALLDVITLQHQIVERLAELAHEVPKTGNPT